ncbi:hypothetical protein OM416_20405 [Paenibacillus sp. LS1]|nr:hypothetical protein [Paenibacillus sp. LS1]
MNDHFELMTFVVNTCHSFWEYETIESFMIDNGEREIYRILGWFPKESNITYTELNAITTETEWIVANIDKEGVHVLHKVPSTSELRGTLTAYQKNARCPEHVTIYPAERLIINPLNDLN